MAILKIWRFSTICHFMNVLLIPSLLLNIRWDSYLQGGNYNEIANLVEENVKNSATDAKNAKIEYVRCQKSVIQTLE